MIPAVSEIAQQRTVRLIPTAHYKPPVLRALVDDVRELQQLEKLEAMTSGRLTNGAQIIDDDYDKWGRTLIKAAYTYCRKSGNRFNDEGRGLWYAAFDERTALSEVAYHKTRELGYIGHFHDAVQYRALNASFIGRFHDLRNAEPSLDCLHPDPAIGYPAGQALANRLIAGGSRGLIYPSVRYKGGACLAAFQPNVIQDLTPGAVWKIMWDGSPDWTATAA